MTFSSIILKNFKHNFSKYISFFFVNSFIVAVLYMYGSLMFNEGIVDTLGDSMRGTIMGAYGGLALFATAFIWYTSYSFIKYRGKEFGVYLTLGMTNKDLKKIVNRENILISIGSIVTGLVVGLVFSKLFYLLLGKIIKVNNLPFEISISSILVTVGVFLLIFLLSMLFTNIYLNKIDVINLIRSNSKAENHKDRPFLAIICLILSVIIIALLPSFLKGDLIDTSEVVTGIITTIAIAIVLISPFIIIGNLISIIKKLISKNKKTYNNNILVLSNLSHKFTGYKVILYIVTLLGTGAIFFMGFGYGLYSNVKREIEKTHPYDEIFVEAFNSNRIEEDELKSKLKAKGVEINEHKRLEHIALPSYKYDGEKVVYYSSAQAVVSESIFNEYSGESVNIDKGQLLAVSKSIHGDKGELNRNQGTEIYLTLETSFDSGERAELFTGEDYSLSLEEFKKHVQDDKFIKLENNEEKVVIYNFANSYHNQLSYASGLYVVDDEDYDNIKSKLSSDYVRYFNSINFKGDSIKAHNELMDVLREVNKNDSLWIKKVDKNAWYEIENEPEAIMESLRPESKQEELDAQVISSGFAFFTFLFLGILFLMSTGVVLLYKTMTSVKEEQDRVKTLRRLGVTKDEMKKALTKELRIIFFLPVIFGSILGLSFIWVMFTNLGEMKFLMTQALYVVIAYALCQCIFYFLTKGKYMREVLRQYR